MALDHCDLDESNTKYPLYQYRAATLHFRIGKTNYFLIFNESYVTNNSSNNLDSFVSSATSRIILFFIFQN